MGVRPDSGIFTLDARGPRFTLELALVAFKIPLRFLVRRFLGGVSLLRRVRQPEEERSEESEEKK